MTELKLRIGSRKSELALKQTYIIEDLLKKAYPGLETEIVTSDTLGDKNLISPLQAFGGKGVFVSELEDALLSGEIDLAVLQLYQKEPIREMCWSQGQIQIFLLSSVHALL